MNRIGKQKSVPLTGDFIQVCEILSLRGLYESDKSADRQAPPQVFQHSERPSDMTGYLLPYRKPCVTRGDLPADFMLADVMSNDMALSVNPT